MNTSLINKAEAEKLAMDFHLLSIGLSMVQMYGNEVRHAFNKDEKDSRQTGAAVFQASSVCGETLNRIMATAKMDTERAYTVTDDVIELIKVVSTMHPDRRAEILTQLQK